MFNATLTWGDLAFLAQGAGMTLAVTAVSVAAGTLLGILFGMIRVELGPYWSAPLTFALDVFRSVPLLIQLVLGNALQSIMRLGWPPFTTSCVVLSLTPPPIAPRSCAAAFPRCHQPRVVRPARSA